MVVINRTCIGQKRANGGWRKRRKIDEASRGCVLGKRRARATKTAGHLWEIRRLLPREEGRELSGTSRRRKNPFRRREREGRTRLRVFLTI